MSRKTRLKELLKLNLDPKLREELGEEGDVVDNLKSIAKTLRTNGGKILIAAILADAKEALEAVLEGYKTMDEIELRSSIAEIGATLRFYKTIKEAESDAQDAEEMLDSRLDELLE